MGTRAEYQRFNQRVLLALEPYLPQLKCSVLHQIQEDLALFGYDFTVNKWHKFIGLTSIPKPPEPQRSVISPDSVYNYGCQVNLFSGRSDQGKTIRMRFNGD